MHSLIQNIRHGFRMLLKSPGYTAAGILALGIGIGANTGIYSIADILVSRPLLLPELDRMVYVMENLTSSPLLREDLSPPDFEDLRAQTRTLDHLAMVDYNTANLTGDGEPERVEVANVSASFFPAMGAPMVVGRPFTETEERNRVKVAVLAHGLWERRFGANPNVLGRTIELSGVPHDIVGVAPREFRFPPEAEVFAPVVIAERDRARRDAHYLTVIARLKPGVSNKEANAELVAFGQNLKQRFPENHAQRGARAVPLAEQVGGDLTAVYTRMMIAAAGVLLLIACANVANLQFARLSSRSREIAVRAALGADRWRTLRLLLTESVLLSLLGSVVGLLFAVWAVDLTRSFLPGEVKVFIPRWDDMSMDWRALLYMIATALAAGVAAGAAPAFLGTRIQPGEALKEGGRTSTSGRRRRWLRASLVVGQMVLAVVLLVMAGLLVKGFNRMSVPKPNLDAAQVMTFRAALSESTYAKNPDVLNFHRRLAGEMSAVSQRMEWSVVTALPYNNNSSSFPIEIEGQPAAPGQPVTIQHQSVSPSYFHNMRIPIERGRPLADTDDENAAKVCLVSRAFADRHYPGQDPLGKRVRVASTPDAPWYVIVGIAGDLFHNSTDRGPRRTIYRSIWQNPPRSFDVIARASVPPQTLAPELRAAMARVDRKQPLYRMLAYQRVIDNHLSGFRYIASMMGVTGFLAIILAAIGTFSLISFAVAERTHEIGVRVALGADPAAVVRIVLRQALVLLGTGAGVGLICAWAAAQAMAGVLFGVAPNDPVTLAWVVGIILISGFAACCAPALRALRVDPITALRNE
ncbi:MAG: ABC transporter permease [Acidobacteria bacterium]|nr:ABC transporter permease [Acidobacteriota bacterium]